MKRTNIIDTPKKVGEKVILNGWVNARRDHGKFSFIDLRDRTGIIQIVTTEDLKPESVIEVVGKVKERPEGQNNDKLPTGKVEVEADKVTVLSKAKTLPFELDKDNISEELRMKYRYLDLRRPSMLNNLIERHKAIKFIRDFLDKEEFIEIETPILTKATPEGSRDFVVPSRLQKGSFYALPQSPQQYKQLLMVSGVEKYYQMARCFRDEDSRSDRLFGEFLQLDLEMSFVSREDVMELNERLLIDLIKTNFPKKKIQEIPFPKISYEEAMQKYKTDRPDLRKDKKDPDLMAFCWVIDWPFFEDDGGNGWTFTHNPFSAPKPEFMDDLLKKKNIKNIETSQYDVVLNGFEVGGGSIRNNTPEALKAVFEIMGYKEKEIEKSVGHMLEAFTYGAPPHGGIAWGFDRFLMTLLGGTNIREVFPFPKTSDGRDLMMGSPSKIEPKQLIELGLSVEEE